MPIFIESRRKQLKTLQKQYPAAEIIDVTSKGPEPWVRFSPFYPHGEIPIPGLPNQVGTSVEGIWQGLKVFEKEGIDESKWAITTMSGIKRSGKSRGAVVGHQFEGRLLDYLEARQKIYLPCYYWVLKHKLAAEVESLCSRSVDLVLLDYETNAVIEELTRPLSHASLVAKWCADRQNCQS